MAKKLRVTQVRSAIGRKPNQRATVRALGIRRMHQTVIHNDTPQIRGMIQTVSHLVRVEEAEHDEAV
jgi:large subunit ribosomal protein L30